MMFRAPRLNAATQRRTPATSALRPLRARPLLARLLLASLVASACTKEAPREPPPKAEELPAAPAPASSPPPPPTSVQEAAPSEQRLREDESDAMNFGVGSGQAAPAKPAAPASKPAAKTRARPDAPRKSAPNDSAATTADKDDSASPESLRRELSKAVDLSTPDCPSARERKQAICDLASQLCQLVDRDPDVASVETYCTDARQRCNEAQRRTAERCPR